jgi:hypothetical protein
MPGKDCHKNNITATIGLIDQGGSTLVLIVAE